MNSKTRRWVIAAGAVAILAYNIPFLGDWAKVTPTLLYDRFTAYGLESALPVASLVILISLIIFVVLRYIALRGEN